MKRTRWVWVSGMTLAALLVVHLLLAAPAVHDSVKRGSFERPEPPKPAEPASATGLPLSFEANLGQVSAPARFLARGSGYRLLLAPSQVTFQVREMLRQPGSGAAAIPEWAGLRLEFPAANPSPQVAGIAPLPGRVNYLVGNDEEKWLTNIPTYAGVRYRELYPGIDATFQGDRRRLALRLVVAPGAEPEDITLKSHGAGEIAVDAEGDLNLRIASSRVRQSRPSAYQEVDGVHVVVDVRFLLLPGERVGFALGEYDTERALFIETSFVCTDETTAGLGDGSEWSSVALDREGSLYVAGRLHVGASAGSSGAVGDAPREVSPADLADAHVIKLDADASTLLFTTYFGGEADDAPLGLAIGDDGRAVITGRTRSRTFPTRNALQPERGGSSDAFVAKLAADGRGFVYSTYLGGAAEDAGLAVAIDGTGNAWLVGSTGGNGFPTAGGAQVKPAGGIDAFVAKLSADGSLLLYSSYVGAEADDIARGITVDESGSVFVAGVTESDTFPVLNPIQPARAGGRDVFVTRLDASGAPAYSTYLGGSGDDAASGIAVDGSGNVYVTGHTASTDFPTTEQAAQPSFGSSTSSNAGDAFVAKLSGAGSALVYSTYLGGSGDDRGNAIGVDGSGHAWIGGVTNAVDFPTADALQPDPGGRHDGFITQVSADGTVWIRSSYLGGGGEDTASGIALDRNGAGFITGATGSSEPLPVDRLEPASLSGDAFVARLGSGGESTRAVGCPGSVNFDNTSGDGLWQTASNWDTNVLPGPTDDVCIDGYDVTLSSNTQTIDTLQGQGGGSLTVAGGTLDIATDAQIDFDFTLSAGTLTGAGTVNVSGTTTWSGGAMSGTGVTNANGSLTISGASLSRTLNSAVSATWSSGNFLMGSNAVFNNLAGASFDAQFDGTVFWNGGAPVFDNAGSFTKSAGSGTTTLSSVVFHNTGTVDVNTGTLNLAGGGTHTGPFDATGTTLQFGGGTHDLGAAASITAADVILSNGTANLAGSYEATSSTTVSGATANLTGNVTSLGALTISGGTANFSNTEGEVSASTLDQSGGTLSGTSTVNVSGATTWSGGAMSGTGATNANGSLTISGANLTRTLNSAVSATWSSGNFLMGPNAVFNNLAGASFDAQFDGTVFWNGGAPVFDNAGSFTKSAGSGTTTLSSVVFHNTGTVDVNTGTLNLAGGGTHTGPFDATGTTLQFGGGTHDLSVAATVTAADGIFSGGTVNLPGSYNATSSTTVSGATANFTGSATSVGILSVSAGAANFTGSLPGVGTLTISGGTANFSNTEGVVNPAALDQSGGTLSGTSTVNVSGATTWSGGAMSGTGVTNANGSLTISGASLSRTLNSAVSATWSSGNFLMGSNAVFNNLAGASFDAQFDGTVFWNGGAPVFDNAGSFTKSAGSGTTTLSSVVFHNTGTVDVNTGTLNLAGGGTHTGPFDATGTTLQFGGGTHDLGAAASITAADVILSNGTANLAGSYEATSSTTVSGATANLTGNVTSLGALTISGGTANFSNTEGEVSASTLDQSGGTLSGTSTVNVSGATTWSGGAMSGTGATNANGSLTISGANLTRTLNSAVSATWSSGNFLMGPNAVFNNLAGASFDAQFDGTVFWNGGAPVFDNAGSFTKSAGSGTTTLSSVVFHNTGTVDVNTGTLNLAGGGTHTGPFDATGTTLQFGGGTHDLSVAATVTAADGIFSGGTVNLPGSYNATSSTTVSGATANFTGSATSVGILSVSAGAANFTGSLPGVGTLTISGGTANFSNTEGVVNPAALDQSGGTLSGTSTVNVSGATTWSGGAMSGTGVTNANGSLTISGASLSRTLNSAVSATWSSGNFLMGSNAVFNNLAGASFDAQFDGTVFWNGGAPVFDNAGSFTKSAGSGTTTLSSVVFHNTGTVEVPTGTVAFNGGYTQTAGVTRQNGGSISSSSTLDIQGGVLEGFGTATTDVLMGGSASPGLSPAVLGIDGNYVQTATGSYDVEIGGLVAGTDFDQLNMSGSATLGGVLNVTLINAFTPVLNDTFTVMTFASRSGVFSFPNLPSLPGGLQWNLSYGATSVVLSVGPLVNADLTVTKSDSPDPVLVGGTLTYTIDLTNNGPDDATAVVVTDVLPPNVSFVSATPSQGSCLESSGTVTCDLGDVLNGGGATVTIEVTPTAAGMLSNTASVSSNASDPVPGDESDTEDTDALPACLDGDADDFVNCDGSCLAAPGHTCGDCNDADSTINPDAQEVCDGIDNDCNTLADDGLGAIPELCNGEDENCNGLIDEGNPEGGASCSTGLLGVCDAGTTTCDQGGLSCFGDVGPSPEICSNGLDEDCDGVTDEAGEDNDADGVDNCADNCLDAFNPPSDCDSNPGTPDEQCDEDGDNVGDVCDCTPSDPGNPPPDEVGDTVRVNRGNPGEPTEITWAAVPNATEYHVYRGYRTTGNAFVYDHQCLESNVTTTASSDDLDPRPFTFFYYIVSTHCGTQESGHGTDWGGVPRPMAFECPAATLDDDGDGTEEAADNCPGFGNPSQSDADSDSHGDVCDNCPNDFNPTQPDLDLDGLGNECDPDQDGDGILEDGDNSGVDGDAPCTSGNTVDCDDNCPFNANPLQEDTDDDGIGDACD